MCLVCSPPAAQVVLGNGAAAEEGTETLTGKMDWSSVGSDSSDKRDAGELSGKNQEPTGNQEH